MSLIWVLFGLLVIAVLVAIISRAYLNTLEEMAQLQLKVNRQSAELSQIKSKARSLIRSLDKTDATELTKINIENHKRRLNKLVE